MHKFLGLALVLAITPSLALAEQTTIHHQTTTTHQTYQHQQTQTNQPSYGQRTTTMPMASTGMDMRISQQWVDAQQNLITRHYPEAIDAFQNVLSAQPNNVQALHGLAIALYSQGRYDDALQTIDKAIAVDPVNSQLFFTKGQILDAQDKPQEAIESYLTFTAMTPDDTSAIMAQRRANELYKIEESKLSQSQQNYLQGLQMLSLHQPQQAIPLFEKFQSLDPNNPQGNILLGQAYLELGQPDRAIPYFESAVKLQADNPVAYYRLGSSYELRGQSQNANNAYRKFLQFAPQSQSAMTINQRMGMPQQTQQR
jgi:tetratricopeptide (TPR) repeat protein